MSSSSTYYEKFKNTASLPIDSCAAYRAVETAVLLGATTIINHTSLDAMSGGYAADVVGTAGAVSFFAANMQRSDKLCVALAAGVGLHTARELAQLGHVLANVPYFNSLDGVHDPKDYLAIAAGGLLYMGIDKLRRIVNEQRSRNTLVRGKIYNPIDNP